MSTNLSKRKDQDVLQSMESLQLHQSSTFLEKEKLNLQAEIDSLRGKLYQKETAHKKLQEQLELSNNEGRKVKEERDNLAKQNELMSVKLKTENLNFNVLQQRCQELEEERNMMKIEIEGMKRDFDMRVKRLDSEIELYRDLYEKSDHERKLLETRNRQLVDELNEYNENLIEYKEKIEDERLKKEAIINKFAAVIQNPTEALPFKPSTGADRRHGHNQDQNKVRRIQQELDAERSKYKKIQHEKDDEIAMLNDEINQLKHELDNQRRINEKLKKKQSEIHPSSENNVTVSENAADHTQDYFERIVEIQNIGSRKFSWEKRFAVLSKNKLTIFDSEKKKQIIISIDINQLFHVRPVNEADVIHIKPNDIPRIFQIMYDSYEPTEKFPLCHVAASSSAGGSLLLMCADSNE